MRLQNNTLSNHNALRGWQRPIAIGVLAALGCAGGAGCGGSSTSAEHATSSPNGKPAVTGPAAETLQINAAQIAGKANYLGQLCLAIPGDSPKVPQPDGSFITTRHSQYGREAATCLVTQGRDQTIESVGVENAGKGSALSGIVAGDGKIIRWVATSTQVIDGHHTEELNVGFQVGGGIAPVTDDICLTGTFNCYPPPSGESQLPQPDGPEALAQGVEQRIAQVLAAA